MDGDNSWHCLLCGVHLSGFRQQVAHMRNYNMSPNNPGRCDNVITHPVEIPFEILESESNVSNNNDDSDDGDVVVATVVLLTRRQESAKCAHEYVSVPIPRHMRQTTEAIALDFTILQTQWERCVKWDVSITRFQVYIHTF